jgi:antibiotic biosynthesis monooxygenase (ABM) superfamily enzyme
MFGIVIVRYRLEVQDIDHLNAWRREMDHATDQAEGFLDRMELPSLVNDAYQTSVLRFNSKENAATWLDSANRQKLFLRSKFLKFVDNTEVLDENNLFCSKADGIPKINKWKQWLIVFPCVYPITIIYPLLVNNILASLNIHSGFFLKSILTTLFISLTMVHAVVPFLLNTFNGWLKKGS